MGFEWDENKNRSNRAKHGFSFHEAAEIFFDGNILAAFSRRVGNEDRFQAIGLTQDGSVVLFVVFTERFSHGEKNIRIISARKANEKERNRYYAKHEEREEARRVSAPEGDA